MVAVEPTLQNEPAPTLPRLQAINQKFTDLDEQLRQSTNIIGLPDDWITIEEEENRDKIIQQLARPRAEWLLRWLLDKLKNETNIGKIARGNITAWKLLGWMTLALPVSRSTIHLRDASLPSILERTLFEAFDDVSITQSTSTSGDTHMTDGSESNETPLGDLQPSRKRKRGKSYPVSSNPVATSSAQKRDLFHAVRSTIGLMVNMTSPDSKNSNETQPELTKMMLRTESAQASRILRFWLTGVHQILKSSSPATTQFSSLDHFLELSVILEIWELRSIDSKDETGESEDEFSTECLIPVLNLLDGLKSASHMENAQISQVVLDNAMQTIDRLLAKHLIAPCRAAFFANVTTESTEPKPSSPDAEANALITCLQPLQAKLLEAAEIEDNGGSIPATFVGLFKAIPHLLDLAIRASPARTPKGRLVESPWIQAIFQSLADCAGCSLTSPPAHAACRAALGALGGALRILKSHAVGIDSEILKKLFWYHCVVDSADLHKKRVHWSLVASLVELDASIFVIESPSHSKNSHAHSKDLTKFIFDQISTETHGRYALIHDPLARHSQDGLLDTDNLAANGITTDIGRSMILERIICPLISAFVRYRNLLGFLRRWDQQLMQSYEAHDDSALLNLKETIWEDLSINGILSEVLEQSLTQGQTTNLIVEHLERMTKISKSLNSNTTDNKDVTLCQKAFSSSVIVAAILQSLKSDQILEANKPNLHSLFLVLTSWVHDSHRLLKTRLAHSWFTLCQLLSKFWPLELHDSSKLQLKLLHSLMKQAIKETAAARKNPVGKHEKSLFLSAATLFLLEACSHLQTVKGSEHEIQKSLRRTLQILSSDVLESKEYTRILECFCANFATLLARLDADACRDSLHGILSSLSNLEGDASDLICNSLSVSITRLGSSSLRQAYSLALVEGLRLDGDCSSQKQAMSALLSAYPSAFSREHRELLLDLLIEHLNLKNSDTTRVLSAMVHLLHVPNATAKISRDGTVLINIAKQIHHKGIKEPPVLQLFRQLVQLTLSHVISNEKQEQNQSFLEALASQVDRIVNEPKLCSAASLSVLRAVHMVQKSTIVLETAQYVELLKACLASDSKETASLYEVLDAFNELNQSTLESTGIWNNTQTWLGTWIKENSDIESYMSSSTSSPVEVVDYVARLHTANAEFKLFTDVKWFVKLTIRFFRESLPINTKSTALATCKEIFASLSTSDKLALVPGLIEVSNLTDKHAAYSILKELVSTLEDSAEADAELKRRQLALLPQIVVLLGANSDFTCFNLLLNSINVILNGKPSLATQYGIECVLSALSALASQSSPDLPMQYAPEIFSRLCETCRLILLVHRGRLGGRFHLLLPLLQGLLFCLFTPNGNRSNALPPWLRTAMASEPVRLGPVNANRFSRILLTLCNPPQSSITKAHQHHKSRKSKDLNDPVRAARETTSRFLYPVLASFCRFQLNGRLDQSVREKLMPGMWEVIGTASLHKEGLEAMFAGLSRSERDIWRGLWGDWETLFGRKG